MTPSELAKLQLENVTTWMAFSQAGGGVAPFTAEGSMPACENAIHVVTFSSCSLASSLGVT